MHSPEGRTGNPRVARILWAAFSLFIVYGTTIPFRFDSGPTTLADLLARIEWHPLGMKDGDISAPDLFQNVLLFIPFGFLGLRAGLLPGRGTALVGLAAVTALGAALSATVEMLQLFTADRVSALSDVIFNSLGSLVGGLLGAALSRGAENLRRIPAAGAWLAAPSAHAALVLGVLALAGAWEPFDFGLDFSLFKSKIKTLLRHPLELTLLRDEVTAVLRFFLATFFLCRLVEEAAPRWPRWWTLLLLVCLALGLEASQLIVASRAPSLQDAAVAIVGVMAGGLAQAHRGYRRHPVAWALAAAAAISVSAALEALHPFRLSPVPTDFKWIPFLSEYSQTTFTTLSAFLSSVLCFFPLGYLVGHLFGGKRRPLLAALAFAGVVAMVLEALQGRVAGRYSDITDVIGAVMGCFAGGLVFTQGSRNPGGLPTAPAGGK